MQKTMLHMFTMTEDQAERIHQQVRGHCAALKNWMANAVERNDMVSAQRLVEELRHYEALFAAFNMQAKHDIAKHTSKPLETSHVVREPRLVARDPEAGE